MRILIALALVASALVGCKTTGAKSSGNARKANDNWSGDGITQQPAGRSTTVRNAFSTFQY